MSNSELQKPIPTVIQSGAQATGDIVGGNKYESTTVYAGTPANVTLAAIKKKLLQEIAEEKQFTEIISALSRYYEKRSHDGVDGLEAKLNHAHRQDEVDFALEQKERFSKLLARWSHYQAAQELFAQTLATTEYLFNQIVRPQIGKATEAQLNEIISDKIVTRLVNDVGTDVFQIDHCEAAGMVYWLAEQCFVRWHK